MKSSHKVSVYWSIEKESCGSLLWPMKTVQAEKGHKNDTFSKILDLKIPTSSMVCSLSFFHLSNKYLCIPPKCLAQCQSLKVSHEQDTFRPLGSL